MYLRNLLPNRHGFGAGLTGHSLDYMGRMGMLEGVQHRPMAYGGNNPVAMSYMQRTRGQPRSLVDQAYWKQLRRR